MEQSSPSSRGAVGSTESIQPLLSLDAVRVALRKLDASRDATKASLDGLHTPLSNPRGRERGFRGGRGRGRGGTRKKSVVPRLRHNNEGRLAWYARKVIIYMTIRYVRRNGWIINPILEMNDQSFTLKESHRMMTPDQDQRTILELHIGQIHLDH